MAQRNTTRRRLLQWLAGAGGVLALNRGAQAHHTETHFGDTVKHKLIYQCNKADPEYLHHITFSVGEMLRKYGDDIYLIVVAFGPGLNILGKKPVRPIPEDITEHVKSLASYGVHFHACGNTMKALKWTQDDLFDFAEVVPIGVDDIMRLQEKGFAYLSW